MTCDRCRLLAVIKQKIDEDGYSPLQARIAARFAARLAKSHDPTTCGKTTGPAPNDGDFDTVLAQFRKANPWIGAESRAMEAEPSEAPTAPPAVAEPATAPLPILIPEANSRHDVHGPHEARPDATATTKPPAPLGVREAAMEALDAGLCPFPPRQDGSKAPDASGEPGGKWKPFQTRRSTPDDVVRWYGDGSRPCPRSGLGLFTGDVSGKLECFEFDKQGEAYQPFKDAAESVGLGDLIRRIEAGYLERSPSMGAHWLYYCDLICGNTKLAEYESDEIGADGKPIVKALIETRGNGGYIVTAPSNGRVHPTGGAYQLLSGGFRSIARITPEERQALWDLARTFDRLPEPEVKALPKSKPWPNSKDPDTHPGSAPEVPADWPVATMTWDDYNAKTEWADLLPGWTYLFQRADGLHYLRRPGEDKKVGWSATIRPDTGRLWVFTTSTQFMSSETTGKAYSKFDAYACIHHGNDEKAAFIDLCSQGYGSHHEWVWVTGDGGSLFEMSHPVKGQGMVWASGSGNKEGEWVVRALENPIAKGHQIATPANKPDGRPRGKEGVSGSVRSDGAPTAATAKPSSDADGHTPHEAEDDDPLPPWPTPDTAEVEAIIAKAETFKSGADVLADQDFLTDCARLDVLGFDRVVAIFRERPKIRLNEFKRAVNDKRPKSAGPDGAAEESSRIAGYHEEGGCLYQGVFAVIANFTARIVNQIERHEAGEVRRLFEIQATHKDGRHVTVAVPAAKYNAMDWVPDQLGAEFVILAGKGVKDDVRAAIQLFSDRDGVTRSVVHTSLGWVEHEGEWIYVHARGCISRAGPFDAVKVETASALAPYFLPDPPTTREGIAEAVGSAFRLLDIGKGRCPVSRQCSAVLMALPWRAVLAPFNSSIHFSGPSGTRKTSAARLALGFFSTGAGARDGKVSVSWGATLNALQRYAFDCRDSLLMVDELTGDKAISTATEFFQNQGNLSARARMTKDKQIAPSLDPRGSVLSTGEADPTRRSALGRMLTVRFTSTTLDDDEVLDRCQKDSEDGLHATATAAYIHWLAELGRLESMRARLRKRTREIDRELRKDPRNKDVHSRQPEAVAELIAALEIFLDFAVESAGVARLTADAYLETVEADLIDLLRAQADQHKEADPAQRFISMLAAGLGSRRFHLEAVAGDIAPEPYASALGWSREDTSRGFEWKIPGGSTRLGYVDVANGLAYVDPELAKSLAQTMGRDAGQPFESTGNIARDLHEAGMLKVSENEEGRKVRLTPKKWIRGASKRYLWILLDHLVGDPGQPPDVPS